MIVKLTTQDMKTQKGKANETQWVLGEWHEAKGTGKRLCSDAYLHFYPNIEMAILRNCMDANIKNPRAFECEAKGVNEETLKCGAKWLRIVREIRLPTITSEERVFTAILLALDVYDTPEFEQWAVAWCDGKRDKSAGERAVRTAKWTTSEWITPERAAAMWATEAAIMAAWPLIKASERATELTTEVAIMTAEAAAKTSLMVTEALTTEQIRKIISFGLKQEI